MKGRLWHATSPEALRSILRQAMIRPDAAPIYPNGFCRTIGAVSLFDLTNTEVPPGASHWSQWFRGPGETSYWLEIDRASVANALLSPVELLARWCGRTRIIAGVEAGHLGPIPLEHVSAILGFRRKPSNGASLAELLHQSRTKRPKRG